MILASHASVARGEGVWWSYDGHRRSVHLSFDGGTVDVPVCSPAAPVSGSFEIERIDPCTWRLLPVRYTRSLRFEVCPLHVKLGIDTVTLLETPDEVGIELAELGR